MNLDSLRTLSLRTDSEVSLGLIAHLITYVSNYSVHSGLTTVSQFVPSFFLSDKVTNVRNITAV